MNNLKVEANKNASIVVKCEFITAPLIRVKANKTMLLKSVDASKSVMVETGSVFYLAKAESLGEGLYYVITFNLHAQHGMSCHCPAFRTCKHARIASTHHIDYCKSHKPLQRATPAVDVTPAAVGRVQEVKVAQPANTAPASAPVASKIAYGHPLPAAPVGKQSPAVKGSFHGQQGFSVLATRR